LGTKIGFPDLVLLKVLPFEEERRRYKSDWLQHVTRMNNMMPKIMLNYRPNGLKTIWKTFEQIVRRGWNRSVKA
jgi:hypothetical protein